MDRVNAVVVGRIVIGDDVLIAPNAYVNFDVPSHSVVVGNPGKIISRENVTEGYIASIRFDGERADEDYTGYTGF